MKPRVITLFDFVEGQSVAISREIGRIEGFDHGPNLVCIGGMHGNEPSGVLALNRAMRDLKKLQPLLRGNVYALAGNLTALERGERYIHDDLNRIWQADRVERAKSGDFKPGEIINEIEEQVELWGMIDGLMETRKGPFIFVDLHTTSAHTIPFITLNDTLMNRKLARGIPVPVVLGIEEFLSEPLLSYVNDLGCQAIAFEAGQHNDPSSLHNHEAFLWMILERAGLMKKIEIPKYNHYRKQLKYASRQNNNVYEILYRENIDPGDEYKTIPGFVNFQAVHKGQVLALKNDKQVVSPLKGQIFMPMYQSAGSDGFFIIKSILKFWLVASWVFRLLNLYQLLHLLPGVSRFMKSNHLLVVNNSVARWYSKEILHLMGYRRSKTEGNTTLFIRRKYDFKTGK